MRRSGLVLATALLATSALAHDTTTSYSSDAEQCSGRNVMFNGRPAFVQKETIDARGLRSLKASVTNAPISVAGGAPAYEITVCKAAERQQDLAAIHVRLDGNELEATGPDDHRWQASYFIRVPDGADLDLSAKNGPLSIRDVVGTVVARSHNGPLSLKNVDGNVDAETRNGPISVNGGSGEMKVSATNGPLSVKLSGASWNGTLDASTKNGPLSVSVPRHFASGVVVEAHGRGPIACNADACNGNRRARTVDGDWDDEPRRIELGSGPVNVRLSTVNGPVTIKDYE